MKFTKVALTLLCSITIFCGCGKFNDDNIVLKVNDQAITKKQFYEDFNKIKNMQLKDAPRQAKKDTSLQVLSIKERYTNDFIVRTLLSQEFEKRKIEASEDEINAKIEQIKKQIGSQEQLDKILKEGDISNEKFRFDMANEVKMDKLMALIYDKPVTDADAQKYYNENKAQFQMPETVLVSHILIDTNPESIKRKITDDDKEAKLSAADIDSKVKAEVERKQKLALEVREKAVKNPANFAQLAKEYSEDEASAQKGGDLGYIVKGQMVPEFNDAAFNLKVGTISPLVKTQYGEHIIIVKDKAKAGIQPFAKIKDDLRQFLDQQKKIKAVQVFVSNLKAQAKVEYIDESLNPNTLNKQIEETMKKEEAAHKKLEADEEVKLKRIEETTQKEKEEEKEN